MWLLWLSLCDPKMEMEMEWGGGEKDMQKRKLPTMVQVLSPLKFMFKHKLLKLYASEIKVLGSNYDQM